jgi:MFS transporter, DHA2 family, multidrug resistance protein
MTVAERLAAAPGSVSVRAATPPPAPQPQASLVEYGTRRTLVVVGVMLAALLQTVDLTIVNVALPTIQGNLGATVDEGTWVLTAYVIANVVVIPMTPWLQVRFGRKNYFLVSIAGFTLASVLCGMATSLNALILFRVIQGAFGGGLLATAQVILRDTYPISELGTSQSIFALGTILGPSLGPTLGGIITDDLSWPWVFDVNVLPGIAAFVILLIFLRDNARPQRTPVDTFGIMLLIATVGTMQYVLDQGQHDDWFSDPSITMCTIVAVTAGATFIWWELRAKRPIVDLRIFRRSAVTAALSIAATYAAVIFPALLLLPQFTVDQLGFTATLAGFLIAARALPVALLTIPVGRLANSGKLDLRWPIGLGLAVAGLGSLWLGMRLTTDSNMESFMLPLLLIGFAVAFVYSPLLVATMRAVAPDEGAKAASFIVLFFQLGGSISSAAVVAIVDRREQFHQTVLAAQASLNRLPVVNFLHDGHSLKELAGIVESQAAALAYADAFLITGALAILVAPLVLLLKRRKTT